MVAFGIYLLKSSAVLGVFYLFYRLLLHKETFYGLNRAILLGIGVLALVLPLCTLTFHKYVLLPSALRTSLQTPVADTVAEAAAPPLWPLVLLVVYALGLLVKAGHTCVSVFSVWRLIRRGRRLPQDDGAVLVVTQRPVAPFSWMRYIVLSEADYASGDGAVRTILLHERTHIRKRHSWDLLFIDGLLALQWFNPAVWLLRRDLRALHEYEADAAVLRSGIDARQYQYLLLNKMVGGSVFALTDRFNQQTLKNRIAMMLSSKSAPKSAWKALYLVPFIGLALAANAKTVVEFQPIVIDMPEAVAAKQLLVAVGDTQQMQVQVVRAPAASVAVTKSAAKSVKVKSDADTQQIQIMVVPASGASKAVTKSAVKSVKVKTDAGTSQDDMLIMTLEGNDTAAIAVSFAAVKDTLNAILSAPSKISNYLVSVIKEGVDNLFETMTVEQPIQQITLTSNAAEAEEFEFDFDFDKSFAIAFDEAFGKMDYNIYVDGKKADIKRLESLEVDKIANINIDKSDSGYTLHITTGRKTKH
ncbi:MAG: M56 family metallopeptidase [Bacteroidales bacterium]|nr:M56 family metallopeptidase [Bacteroidales bacterium]